MHYTIINTYYPTFNRNNEKLVKQLAGQVDRGPINVYDFLDKCTLTMICGVISSLFFSQIDF